MKVLVVEGEQRVVKKLEQALKSIDDSIRIIGAIPSFFIAANWLQHGIPDIILMSKEVVREQLSALAPSVISTTVIFQVQSDEFTYQAFRFTSLGHLLPKSLCVASTGNGALPGTMKMAKPQLPLNGHPVSGLAFKTRFLVKQGQKFASIETTSIAYFFSEGRFIFFKTFDNQKYLVEYNLEELETMLNPEDFFRVNRSLLIAFRSVLQIHPYFGNRLKLFLEPPSEKDVIVSREKVGGFKTWLGQ